MDFMPILWWCLLGLCLCFGFLGCFVNKVPGPIAVVIATIIGLACLNLPITWTVVSIIAVLAIASMVASKVLVKLVQKLHEYSKKATWGTTIGSIVGLCLLFAVKGMDSMFAIIMILIVGLVVVPFVLAFLLELTNKQGAPESLKCATAATGAYLADTCLKLVVFVYAVYVLFMGN